MNAESTVPSQSVRSIVTLAAVCVIATIVVTLAGTMLDESMKVTGTLVLLTLLWIIAVVEVLGWLRLASPRSLSVSPFKGTDIAIGLGTGVILMLLVPLFALAADKLLGAETGTLQTSSRLNMSLAAAGVITAAVTEEIVYRAGAMSALLAIHVPKWLVLLLPAIIFAAVHWSWGLVHMAFVALPLGIGLGALFLWRRSLYANMMAHAIVDIPVVILAAGGSA